MLDRTHLSRQGYSELGGAIASELLHAYDAYRAAASRDTTAPRGLSLLPLPPIRESASAIITGKSLSHIEPGP
jgi:hypothetical protein